MLTRRCPLLCSHPSPTPTHPIHPSPQTNHIHLHLIHSFSMRIPLPSSRTATRSTQMCALPRTCRVRPVNRRRARTMRHYTSIHPSTTPGPHRRLHLHSPARRAPLEGTRTNHLHSLHYLPPAQLQCIPTQTCCHHLYPNRLLPMQSTVRKVMARSCSPQRHRIPIYPRRTYLPLRSIHRIAFRR